MIYPVGTKLKQKFLTSYLTTGFDNFWAKNRKKINFFLCIVHPEVSL